MQIEAAKKKEQGFLGRRKYPARTARDCQEKNARKVGLLRKRGERWAGPMSIKKLLKRKKKLDSGETDSFQIKKK